MKIRCLLVLVFACVISVSCSRKWDFLPYDVCIFVESTDGENLLDPAVEGNILDDEIYIDYNGATYELQKPVTRAIKPFWNGFRIEPYSYPSMDFDWSDATLVLKFGEFGPQTGYRGETFTIHWGDGTSNEVKFDLFIRGEKVKRTLWIDGELVSDDSLVGTIVK